MQKEKTLFLKRFVFERIYAERESFQFRICEFLIKSF